MNQRCQTGSYMPVIQGSPTSTREERQNTIPLGLGLGSIIENFNKENREQEHHSQEFEDKADTENVRSVLSSPNNQAELHSINIVDSETRNRNEFSQSSVQQRRQNFSLLWETEVKIHIAKVIGSLVAALLLLALLLLQVHFSLSYDQIFAEILSYLLFLLIVDLIWTRKVLKDVWMKSDNITQVVNTIVWAFSLLIFYFKYLNVFSLALFACLPFLLVATISLFFSKVPIHKKFRINFFRVLNAFEILLIASKVDDYIEKSWVIMFILPWICLAITLTVSLVKTLKPPALRSQPDPGNKIKNIGLLWYVIYYCFIFVVTLSILGAVETLSESENKDSDFFKIVAHVGLGMGTLLLVSTLLLRNHLIRFIISFNFIQSYFTASEQPEDKDADGIVKFCVEKKEDYFVMISPSYFVPFKRTHSRKNQGTPQVSQRMYNNLKYQSETDLPESRRKINKHYNIANYGTLRQFKDDLDRIFYNINTKNKRTTSNKSTKLHGEFSMIIDYGKEDVEVEKETEHQLSLSFDGAKCPEKSKENVSFKSREVCYICYVNKPNVILVNCGHGGICLDCAYACIKKKNECLACRRKVKGFYKITSTPVFSNIFKGIEFTKITS